MTMPDKLRLILASQSPFRKMLMENAGLAFDAFSADIDERAVESELERQAPSPTDVALHLAAAKARAVSMRHPGALVIGSDQTLSLGERVFHKPEGIAGAKEHLLALSGRTHALNSGVAIAVDGEVAWRHVSTASLTMRPLSEAFIDRHLSRVGTRVLGSVGAYQLEGEGIQLFDRIEGDYFTIIGLPMLPLLAQLRSMRAIDA
ncbi:septum formation protein [Rhizobium subbaraonis]|uniref:7-methyl-GTP pyrophosphatase n=1 Tax=Rhizobium subbaraonis TaxID=908946 RepID=A0A285U6C4_9HYPH|nr:Maf-like protein [Rhizobium subbaraonis]SOC37237.1 septum formation protein [Rhizobium subbaraonis]